MDVLTRGRPLADAIGGAFHAGVEVERPVHPHTRDFKTVVSKVCGLAWQYGSVESRRRHKVVKASKNVAFLDRGAGLMREYLARCLEPQKFAKTSVRRCPA